MAAQPGRAPRRPEQVRRAWGLTIRDGYGQTETTAQIGNTAGQPIKPGSMGRPLPGYVIDLIDPAGGAHGETGEICIDLSRRPVALMVGYRDDGAHTAEVPKTISGKIRRVDLRAREVDLREQTERARAENEYWEEDFPDLRTAPTR
jgi:acetyl-CoA synthetase